MKPHIHGAHQEKLDLAVEYRDDVISFCHKRFEWDSNRITSEWDKITCPHCLKVRESIERWEREKAEEVKRIGWWEVYRFQDIPMGYGYGEHIRFVYGRKPEPANMSEGVDPVSEKNVYDDLNRWQKLVDQTREAIYHAESAMRIAQLEETMARKVVRDNA